MAVNILVSKPKILIICNYYLPGYKGGGGLRTVVHMVECFKDKFNFNVITRDHDTDKIPYTSVKTNSWNTVEGAQVYYLPQKEVKIAKLRKLILEVKPDSIYLNSVFSTLTIFLLILRKAKLIPDIKVILAPEGEFAVGALQIKAGKKKVFLKLAKIAGLYKDLIWKTTTEQEKKETQQFEQRGGKFFIAPNIPSQNLLQNYQQNLKPEKKVGQVKIVFLSRIMLTKNLKWLIDNLQEIREGSVEIDIIGPIENEDYWRETQASIDRLPSNVQVTYKGLLEYHKVLDKLFEYHFFILPTLGENFGHVFIEALAAGCPLIISNRTPWLNLEEKVIGWDLPLEEPEKWQDIINLCIGLDNATYTKLSSNARKFAIEWLETSGVEKDTLEVIEYSLENKLT